MNYEVILEYSYGSLPILMYQELSTPCVIWSGTVPDYFLAGPFWVYDQVSNYDPLFSTVNCFYSWPKYQMGRIACFAILTGCDHMEYRRKRRLDLGSAAWQVSPCKLRNEDLRFSYFCSIVIGFAKIHKPERANSRKQRKPAKKEGKIKFTHHICNGYARYVTP